MGVRLLVVAVTALLLLTAGSDVVGMHRTFAPFGPFVAQVGSGQALLALRGGLLAVAAWPAAAVRDPRALRTFAGVALLFVASVVAEGLLLVFVLVSLAVILRSPLPPLPWPSRAQRAALILGWAGVACLALGLGLAALRGRGVPASGVHPDPATEAARWLARDNVYRARYWSRRAAAQAGRQGSPPPPEAPPPPETAP
jgi:hypothetical protein